MLWPVRGEGAEDGDSVRGDGRVQGVQVLLPVLIGGQEMKDGPVMPGLVAARGVPAEHIGGHPVSAARAWAYAVTARVSASVRLSAMACCASERIRCDSSTSRAARYREPLHGTLGSIPSGLGPGAQPGSRTAR